MRISSHSNFIAFFARGNLIGNSKASKAPPENIAAQDFVIPLDDESPWQFSFYQLQFQKYSSVGHFLSIVTEDQVSGLQTNTLAFAIRFDLVNSHAGKHWCTISIEVFPTRTRPNSS